MTFRRIVSFLIGLAVIAGVIAVYMWQGQSREQRSRRAPLPGPVPVLAATAVNTDVPVYLDGVGTTRALNTVTVRAQVDGQLIKILFREGQDVRRGDVLAEIDARTYQAQYDQAVAKKAQDEATLANARLDLDRYNRLVAANSGSKQQADTQKALVAQLNAQVNSDQAAIDNTRAILSYTKVVAPIDGRTGIRLIDEGNLVRASDAAGIVVITQVKPISILFNLPQQQLPQISKAFAKGGLQVEAMGTDGKTIIDRGTLQVIDNQIDPATGTVRLKAEFPNAELQLWSGQFVNVRLLIETLRQVVVVPTAAVQRGPTGTFVFVVGADNTVAVRPVTVSMQDDTRAVIPTGLQADERVVTTGFTRLAAGTRVAVQTAGETPPAAAPGPVAPRPEGRRKREGERPEGERKRKSEPSATQ
jgi:membrane fusion protein, multidrug efflux system